MKTVAVKVYQLAELQGDAKERGLEYLRSDFLGFDADDIRIAVQEIDDKLLADDVTWSYAELKRIAESFGDVVHMNILDKVTPWHGARLAGYIRPLLDKAAQEAYEDAAEYWYGREAVSPLEDLAGANEMYFYENGARFTPQ